MTVTRVNKFTKIIRLVRLLSHIASGLLQSLVYPHLKMASQNHMVGHWARQFLHILNIKLRTSGALPPVNNQQGVMLVANHISWMDILVILAVFPSRFVAKAEIRTWPLLGWLSMRAGTLFIQRDKRSDTLRVNRTIGRLLGTGYSIAVFPEGTTSDGGILHHFHASLLHPAVNAQTFLQPTAIRYRDTNGMRNTAVPYVEISIVQSLMRILNQPGIEAELIFEAPISCTGKNRRELARLAEQSISRALSLDIIRMVPETPSYPPSEQQ